MQIFNVLDRTQNIHRNIFLEASAGTGKTFTIENIILRLLVEEFNNETPLTLEKILVVTFTRASTQDLKGRIRANLEKCLSLTKEYLIKGKILNSCPDFLHAILEKGINASQKVKKHLEKALCDFDQAQIFTIHSFCWRMLKNFAIEGNVSLESSYQEETSPARLMQIIRDFLRTELLPQKYSHAQLTILLKMFNGDVEELETNILRAIDRGLDILVPPLFSEVFEQFQNIMIDLKKIYAFESYKIMDDFFMRAPSYIGLKTQSKQIHSHILEKIQWFANLFDKVSWEVSDLDQLINDGLLILDLFDKSRLSKKGAIHKEEKLHYPEFLIIIKNSLSKIIGQLRNENIIFAQLLRDFQIFMRKILKEEEIFGHAHLLKEMKGAVKNFKFSTQIRQSYLAVMIDEFQDTDPIQWEIFIEIFGSKENPWKGYLYLVGDPKQSIYAFRQADIYTYLKAGEFLGPNALATLNTNYRSDERLIYALNQLFSAATGFFPLPRELKLLPFVSVIAGNRVSNIFNKEDSCLQFWAVESTNKNGQTLKELEKHYFFPAIGKELIRLHQEGIKYEQCAVLIADRFQEARLKDFLRECNIPVNSFRGADISKSSAVDIMRELIQGILFYQKESYLKIAFSSRVIGMTLDQLLALEDQKNLAKVMKQCNELRQDLFEKGFGSFYYNFMSSSWHSDGKSVLESLLSQRGGYEFYREWQDLAELLIYEQSVQKLSIEGLIAFLDDFQRLSATQDERLKVYLDPEEKGVCLLTIHASKGLEFDIVFSLGLIKRTQQVEQMISTFDLSESYLEVVEKEDKRYVKHCEEIDAEKMRQLYVAFTRAKYRLYIPIIRDESSPNLPIGTGSPMDLFLARLNQEEFDYEGLYKKINAPSSNIINDFVNKYKGAISLHNLEAVNEKIEFRNDSDEPLLQPPLKPTIPITLAVLQSFTSLFHHNEVNMSSVEESFVVPFDFGVEEKTAHTLPAGAETGLMLHHILEQLSFDSLRGENNFTKLLPVVQNLIRGSVFEAWDEVITKIIFNALKQPLDIDGKTFCLADVDCKKIYRETEFLYSVDKSYPTCQLLLRPGYVKGVIDLFFEYNKKYFLLDWKSNWLGPEQKFYIKKNLDVAMRENGYDQQAILYIEALKKYLNLFTSQPFEDIFGGVYYFFLRGIGSCTGVYHFFSENKFISN